MKSKDSPANISVVAAIAAVIAILAVLGSGVRAQDQKRISQHCEANLERIKDLIGEVESVSERIGRVKRRMKDEKKGEQAYETDQDTLNNAQELIEKQKSDIDNLSSGILGRNPVCVLSAGDVHDLVRKLQETSEDIGNLRQGLETPGALSTNDIRQALDKELAQANSIKTDIYDRLSACCPKAPTEKMTSVGSMSPGPDPYQVSVDYQYMHAPDEAVKNLNGFDVQFSYDIKPQIGVGVDFGCAFGSDQIGATTDVSLRRCTFLAGPRSTFSHRLHRDSIKELEIEILYANIGAAFDRSEIKLATSTTKTSASSTAFMMSFGADVDLMFNRHVGVRVVEVAAQPTHFGGDWQMNWKLGTGIVFRFGGKK
jgi:hypothetical protein